MKRIMFAIAFLLGGLFLLTGCTKNYISMPYTKFVETFNKKEGYIVKDITLTTGSVFERAYLAGVEDIQFVYYEFKSTEEARNYVKENYYDRKNYSYDDKGSYITVNCTDAMYFNLVQVDKMVLEGVSDNYSDKGTINGIFKELGY